MHWSEWHHWPMTIHVDSTDVVGRGPDFEVVSPELALVDPELGRAARAHLVDPVASSARARPLATTASQSPSSLVWQVSGGGERSSLRLLVGVAAATVLALLLLDVRVEVGRTPAVAESTVVGPTAGNRSRSAPPAPPRAVTKPRSVPGAAPRTSERRFAWAPVSGASAYHVEFFSGATRVFTANTSEPFVTVPAHWRLDGKRRALRAGEYRWYVWAIVDGNRQSTAVVQTTVSIPAR